MYEYIKLFGLLEKIGDYKGHDLYYYLNMDGICLSELLENRRVLCGINKYTFDKITSEMQSVA